MARQPIKPYTSIAVGGSNTHVVLEFPALAGLNNYLYMGSLVTISYSVHRDKVPVFNCGSPLVDGFSIGNKFVAGSMVTTMFQDDELALFMEQYTKHFTGVVNRQQLSQQITERSFSTTNKPVHTFMSDDLTSFNIHIIFASEYEEAIRKLIVYDATFITSGRVMSIEDLVTETTFQYVARDIKEQYTSEEIIQSLPTSSNVQTGTKLLKSLGKL